MLSEKQVKRGCPDTVTPIHWIPGLMYGGHSAFYTIFGAISQRMKLVMLAGSVPGASQSVFSARRHLILTLMAVYMGTGILISTVIYFIYR